MSQKDEKAFVFAIKGECDEQGCPIKGGETRVEFRGSTRGLAMALAGAADNVKQVKEMVLLAAGYIFAEMEEEERDVFVLSMIKQGSWE